MTVPGMCERRHLGGTYLGQQVHFYRVESSSGARYWATPSRALTVEQLQPKLWAATNGKCVVTGHTLRVALKQLCKAERARVRALAADREVVKEHRSARWRKTRAEAIGSAVSTSNQQAAEQAAE